MYFAPYKGTKFSIVFRQSQIGKLRLSTSLLLRFFEYQWPAENNTNENRYLS